MHTLKVNIAFHRNRESFKSLMLTKQKNGAHEKIIKVHLKACCIIALSSYCIANIRILSNTGKGAAIVGSKCVCHVVRSIDQRCTSAEIPTVYDYAVKPTYNNTGCC